jgi:hypothetical protein
MQLSKLSKEFIFSMVQAMYKYEANMINRDTLLTDNEIQEFYMSYISYGRT